MIQRAKFRHDTLLQFFARAKPAVIGMEACPGSQWLARQLKQMEHSIRIMPAQFVKLYLKANKSDVLYAERSPRPQPVPRCGLCL